jgi:hypothetical protein
MVLVFTARNSLRPPSAVCPLNLAIAAVQRGEQFSVTSASGNLCQRQAPAVSSVSLGSLWWPWSYRLHPIESIVPQLDVCGRFTSWQTHPPDPRRATRSSSSLPSWLWWGSVLPLLLPVSLVDTGHSTQSAAKARRRPVLIRPELRPFDSLIPFPSTQPLCRPSVRCLASWLQPDVAHQLNANWIESVSVVSSKASCGRTKTIKFLHK